MGSCGGKIDFSTKTDDWFGIALMEAMEIYLGVKIIQEYRDFD